MDVGAQALADYLLASKYAHTVDGVRETWGGAATRVELMHREFYGNKLAAIEGYVSNAFKALREKQSLGSQRNMQYGGSAVLKKHARAYNCATTYIDRPRAFAEVFWLLLCGCGVGFSVQKQHVACLPSVQGPSKFLRGSKVFGVPDTIEGWSDALDALLNSYFYGGMSVAFNYAAVRPEGSPLSSGAGVAPGPEPLRVALEAVRTILDRCVGSPLRPIDAYDILMHMSCAVLSGGVRRSATLALFSVDDEEMLSAKSGNWFQENPQRARSNNSAALLRSATTFERFCELVDVAQASGGEPAFIWTDSLDFVFNPCVEVAMRPRYHDGRSGVQFCNLSTINGAACESVVDFLSACEAAATLGTLQAGYTSFPYLGEVSELITRNEALIGVSITGVQDSPNLLLDPATLEAGVKVIREVNETVARALGINAAARLTVIKPEGTSSGLLGCASGKHRRHAFQYIRRVQANANEMPAQAYAAANPDAVEPSQWHEGDLVLKFAIESPQESRLRGDESALDQLMDVVTLQQHWVAAGKNHYRCADERLMNSVSNTITVRPDEWGTVKDFIFHRRKDFTGVSLLPASGDLDYPQAPFVSVDEPERFEQRAEWDSLRESYKPADYSASDGRTTFQAEVACAGGACEIP